MESFVRNVLTRLREQFDPEVLGASLGSGLANVVTAALTFLVFWAAWKMMERLLVPLLERSRVDATTAAFVETGGRYAVLAVGAVAAVGELGIDTTSLVASLGVAGLTVGFAARDALSNVISGLFIYWDRPFVIDDLVEVGGRYGRVDRITIRSTRVITPDGKMLAIPNSEMVNTTVASYTNFPHLRVDAQVTVGTGEDLAEVRELLLGIVRDDPAYLESPAPSVAVRELGDYYNRVQVFAWVEDEREHLAKEAELRERVFTTLSSAGVEMPLERFALEPLEIRRAG
jgi:small conductance mechanosensitive channel